MGKVSKRIVNQDLSEHIFELFIKTIAELKDPEEVKNFLNDLLSPTEKIMLVKRLAIAILLTKGYTYEEIDDKLKVSRSTIMNVSFWLKNGQGGYIKVARKIMGKQKKEDLIIKIEELLIQLSPKKSYSSISFKKKQKQGKNLSKRRINHKI